MCSIIIYKFRADSGIYAIVVFLSFATLGGHFSMFPTVTVKIFGIINGGQIFTFIFFAIPLSTLTMLCITQVVSNVSSVFQISSLFTVVNIISLMIFNESPIEDNDYK